MKKTIALPKEQYLVTADVTRKIQKELKSSRSAKEVALCLKPFINECPKKDYPLLIRLLTKHKSNSINHMIKKVTQRSTPYGHLRWLYKELADYYSNDEKKHALYQSKMLILDWAVNNERPNLNELSNFMHSTGKVSKWLNLHTKCPNESNQILKKCCKIFFKFDLFSDWIQEKTSFDKKNHFMTIKTPCKNKKIHTLHLQKHSGPHIHGYSGNLKNTRAEKEKTRFKSELLTTTNVQLLRLVWETFDPDDFNLKNTSNCVYWNVKCPMDLSGNKDTIFTTQISMIEENMFSIHIYPNKKCEGKCNAILAKTAKKIAQSQNNQIEV
tara:strand:+ start:3885 stop:4862 length:978 start_codon:yes stop_codon:yes gene_type:complete